MSKRKLPDATPRRPEAAATQPAGPAAAQDGLLQRVSSPPVLRETIESIVVAFVLAFLFRTFAAEPFVIPTGSMAPTLMGRHKDLVCPQCGCPYQISASDREDANQETQQAVVNSATCPMCRYTLNLGEGSYPSYSGDRILVGKFCYQLQDPQRWDVVVFHFPGDATKNYIKRLTGLPGETIRISHGALWVRPTNEPAKEFQIARKPAAKLLAMLQPVFDNDYMPVIRSKMPALQQLKVSEENKFPPRWNGAGWTTPDDYASFKTGGAAGGDVWLRYQHLVPSFEQWQEMVNQGGLTRPVKPALITDFVAYNTGQEHWPPMRPQEFGRHWVGDLALDCTLDSRSETGNIVLELIKGGRQFRCQFDLATGVALLSHSGPGAESFHPKATTALRARGLHQVRFANADDQLLVWVDDKLAAFDAPTSYDSRTLQTFVPRPESDLSPVGVGSRGVDLTVSHLKLRRNIYYGAEHYEHDAGYVRDSRPPVVREFNLNTEPDLGDPDTWEWFRTARDADFRLGPNQFFMLGDNSAQSADGRLWEGQHYVDRDLLIGKALVIYWPHSWDKIAGTNVPFPFFPNFKKMGLVR